MKLRLVRDYRSPIVTLGRLYINGVMGYQTLEDCDRKLESGGLKIPKKTAIPRGTYPVIIDFSQRFQKEMLHVTNVPFFDGIRIHAGNSAEDTEGCILVGMGRTIDRLFNSQTAIDALYRTIDDELEAGGHAMLEVV